MLGLLYLIICFVTGYAVLIYVSPNIFRKDKYNFEKKRYRVSPFFLWLPAIGITGIILVTWLVYIMACIFQNSRKPLGLANAVALFIIFNVDYFLLFFKAKKKALYLPKIINRNLKNVITELIYIIFFLTISTWLMYYVFHVKDGNLMIGVTVCSDFAPHTAMIRSFSYGNNFPTMYPYYTGSDVKYHFMFQFLVGNLEFLGMRIDHAFNIPSIIGMSFVYMLLYVLANKISGKVSS